MRQRLERNRRASDVVTITHDRMKSHVTFSRYDDGRIAEVFIKSGRVGSPVEAWARDSAILLSLLLQYGCPLEEMHHALTKLDDGESPASGVGAIVKYLAKEPQTPPPVYEPTTLQRVDATVPPSQPETLRADSPTEPPVHHPEADASGP